MTLFAPDLYRNFIIGFVGGGLILAAGLVDGVDGFGAKFVSEAKASETARTVVDEIDIADEFIIAPERAESVR